MIEKVFFLNDHKLYLMGQKNTFSDHFFSEEALSEEQLIRKSGKTEEEVIIREIVIKGAVYTVWIFICICMCLRVFLFAKR